MLFRTDVKALQKKEKKKKIQVILRQDLEKGNKGESEDNFRVLDRMIESRNCFKALERRRVKFIGHPLKTKRIRD